MCCAVNAASGSCEVSMGELGSYDLVSKGLLSPDGEEWTVRHRHQCGRSSPKLGKNPQPDALSCEVP